MTGPGADSYTGEGLYAAGSFPLAAASRANDSCFTFYYNYMMNLEF